MRFMEYCSGIMIFTENCLLIIKKILKKRIYNFLRLKDFKARSGSRPKFEEQVAVSSAAIIRTFGQSEYMLKMFNTIIIYPDIYTNPNAGNLHRSEANPKHGVIVIS